MYRFIRKIFSIDIQTYEGQKLVWKPWQVYLAFFLLGFGTYYWLIDGRVGMGPFKLALMGSMILCFPYRAARFSKALFWGVLFLGIQFYASYRHLETFRLRTFFYSCSLVSMYVTFYTLVVKKKTLTVYHFLQIIRWMMWAYFVVCAMQQLCILLRIYNFPLINHYYLGRGLGCNSLSMEPSTFARFMLVCYYCYIKCHEWLRGKGKFTLKELFSEEHKYVTVRFLWMMTTMGSGTAYGCLILLALYFLTPRNFLYMFPILLCGFICARSLEIKQLKRVESAARVASASLSTSVAAQQMTAEEHSAMIRIAPMINTLQSDFSDPDTWFGHGVDYANRENRVVTMKTTLSEDYGIIWLLLGYIFAFSCAYKLTDLSAVFMFAGVAGGCMGNIHYAWELAMIMTCLRYFGEHKKDYCQREQRIPFYSN